MFVSTAKKIREAKEKHPERYCSAKGCLWNTTTGQCRKHPNAPIHMGRVVADNSEESDALLAGLGI